MSHSLPSRNVRFQEAALEVGVTVSASARGRAQADAQSRGDGRGSAAIGYGTPASAGVSCLCIALVNAPEPRLWASKREGPPGCLCPALQMERYSSVSTVNVRSMEAAAQTGRARRVMSRCKAFRTAGLGWLGARARATCAGGDEALGRGSHSLTAT